MDSGILIFLVIIAVAVFFVAYQSLFGDGEAKQKKKKEKPSYHYKRKPYYMSKAEHDMYDALIDAVGNDYYVFAQVHLPAIVDHTVKGQNWKAAFRHISQKTVDFVLCDKKYNSPKLAVELDGITHERSDRKKRDEEVERILQEAELPLLRIESGDRISSSELKSKITEKLG